VIPTASDSPGDQEPPTLLALAAISAKDPAERDRGVLLLLHVCMLDSTRGDDIVGSFATPAAPATS